MKKKKPYWYRYIRYTLNAIWFYLLFPTDYDAVRKNRENPNREREFWNRYKG